MKRRSSMTTAQLEQSGYVEYEPDKFAPSAMVKKMGWTVIKSGKSGNKKAKTGNKPAKLDLFANLCEIELKIIPAPEYKFHPDRNWRMDYAFVDQKVFLEVEGGVWTGGRHIRGKGFINDMEKYNAAAAIGWILIRCVPDDLKNGNAIKQLKETL